MVNTMKYCEIEHDYKVKLSNGPNKPYSIYSIRVTEEDFTHIKGTDRDGILRIFAKTNIVSVNETTEGETDESKYNYN